MAFTMIHENYNVSSSDVSISFYERRWAARGAAQKRGGRFVRHCLHGRRYRNL